MPRRATGLDEAIRRGQAYRKAGADVVFVELKDSPTILDDLKRVTAEVDAPCLVNVDGGGKLGELTAAEIGQLGFRIAIYPGPRALRRGLRDPGSAAASLKRDGSTRNARGRMLTPQGIQRRAGAVRYRSVGEKIPVVALMRRRGMYQKNVIKTTN